MTAPPPLLLRTFGGLSVLADGRRAEGAGGQKRRLALLVLVDAAGDRGISRDKLLGYLWPESDPEKARGALAQALYALKKGLGHDDLFTGTNEVHLNAERLSSDRAAFLADLARGDRESAVGRYGGPFLGCTTRPPAQSGSPARRLPSRRRRSRMFRLPTTTTVCRV